MQELAFVLTGGYYAAKHAQDIRDATKKLKQKTEDMRALYSSIEKEESESIANYKQNFFLIYEQIVQINAQIKDSKNKFRDVMRSMQIGAVIIISVVVFLLILKQYDLLGPLMEILLWPFKQIKNLFNKN